MASTENHRAPSTPLTPPSAASLNNIERRDRVSLAVTMFWRAHEAPASPASIVRWIARRERADRT